MSHKGIMLTCVPLSILKMHNCTAVAYKDAYYSDGTTTSPGVVHIRSFDTVRQARNWADFMGMPERQMPKRGRLSDSVTVEAAMILIFIVALVAIIMQ